MTRTGDYGSDAPYVLVGFGVAFAAGDAAFGYGNSIADGTLQWSGVYGLAIGVVCGGSFLYATRIAAHIVWAMLLDELATELDGGCGRGAVLLAAAERVPRGKAIASTSGRGAINGATQSRCPGAMQSSKA